MILESERREIGSLGGYPAPPGYYGPPGYPGKAFAKHLQQNAERCSECVAFVALRDNLTWDDIVDPTYIHYIYIIIYIYLILILASSSHVVTS